MLCLLRHAVQGNQFCKGFGGIGGVLRYSVSLKGNCLAQVVQDTQLAGLLARAGVSAPCARLCLGFHLRSCCAMLGCGPHVSSPAFPLSPSSPSSQVDLTEFEEPGEDDGSDDALWSEEEDFF